MSESRQGWIVLDPGGRNTSSAYSGQGLRNLGVLEVDPCPLLPGTTFSSTGEALIIMDAPTIAMLCRNEAKTPPAGLADARRAAPKRVQRLP